MGDKSRDLARDQEEERIRIKAIACVYLNKCVYLNIREIGKLCDKLSYHESFLSQIREVTVYELLNTRNLRGP